MNTPSRGLAANLPTRSERFASVIAEHRAALTRTLQLCRPTGDRVSDNILSGIARKAKARLHQLDVVEARPDLSGAVSGYDDLGTWGRNGRLPQTMDWLADARFHADAAIVREVAA